MKPIAVEANPEVATLGQDVLPPVDEFLSQFKLVLPPAGNAHPSVKSRIAVREDLTTILVLDAMAERKFGQYDKSYLTATWIDLNLANETWGNVTVMTERQLRKIQMPAGRPKAGTKEYQRAYYEKNRGSVLQWQRNYQARRKARFAELERQAAGAGEAQPLPEGVTDFDAHMQERLDKLRKTFGEKP